MDFHPWWFVFLWFSLFLWMKQSNIALVSRTLMFTTKFWINFDVNSASQKKKVKWRILWQIPPTLPFFAIRMGVVSTRLNFSWLVSFQQLIDREKQMEIIIVQTPLLGELLCIVCDYWLSCICWCICAIITELWILLHLKVYVIF